MGRKDIPTIAKYGLLYFIVVFGTGFVLGTVRVSWLVPRLGDRIAELVEAPIMIIAIVLASRWIVRRPTPPPAPGVWLGVGFIALGLLLFAEFTMVLGLRGLTLREYLANRDPVAGTVYLGMLGAFALMPFMLRRSALIVIQKPEHNSALVGIKLLHSAIWLFFVGCIVAIPVAGAYGRFREAGVLTGLVLIECAVLALNRGRCPLTDLACRYTEERHDNFDIYLPRCLARHNKTIFGTLFVAGEVFVLARWLAS